MQLILIRHAEPEPVAHDPGGADPDLTDAGREQATLLARAFGDGALGPVDALVSSTMRRAVQTAEPLAAALGLAADTDPRIVELDHGWPVYGGDFAAYPSRRAAYDALNRGEWGEQTYDQAAFVARVTEGIEAQVARHPAGTVAVVCHGGVISAYLAGVVGAARPMFFNPPYTSLTRVLAQRDGHRELLTAGETPHLPVRPGPR